MLKVSIQTFEDLSEEEKGWVSNNGSGKEYAGYIRIMHNGETARLESDAMEPEDVRFSRDLAWVAEALIMCYELGKADAKEQK
jgi:hypothetical protein